LSLVIRRWAIVVLTDYENHLEGESRWNNCVLIISLKITLVLWTIIGCRSNQIDYVNK